MLQTTHSIPTYARALVLAPPLNGKPTYEGIVHDMKVEWKKIPQLKDGEVLVKITAAGFNHRDVSGSVRICTQRGAVIGCDGAGMVVAAAQIGDPLLHQRVFLAPMRGWVAAPEGPEVHEEFSVIGGVNTSPVGTFAEYMVVDRLDVVPSPDHLTDTQMAACPGAGTTAWRAVKTKANVQAGQNVLVTGIGGGTALFVLQFCLALGANVYVTSGEQGKIDKAIAMGAKGGVNYKSGRELAALVSKTDPARPYLDSVIDSAGGEIAAQTVRALKPGGVVVVYGMTASPKISLTMREVMKNIELKGSMLSSRQELWDATAFMAKHKIVPVISHVLHGLENAEQGFKLIATGEKRGKIVLNITHDGKQVAKL